MKLYSSPFSPYAARVRAQIRLKNLPIAIEPPPGGLRTAEYRAVNPTGKVPALLLELPDRNAVIKAQLPMAAAIWLFNVVAMYVCVYRF